MAELKKKERDTEITSTDLDPVFSSEKLGPMGHGKRPNNNQRLILRAPKILVDMKKWRPEEPDRLYNNR